MRSGEDRLVSEVRTTGSFLRRDFSREIRSPTKFTTLQIHPQISPAPSKSSCLPFQTVNTVPASSIMDNKTSQDLRVKGNEAYLAGEISDGIHAICHPNNPKTMLTGPAISLYREAADLSPTDPAPLSNLSAAFFESGDYHASITASDQSLKLTKDEAKRQKLYARKAKSFIHSLNYKSALETLKLLDDSVEKARLHTAIQNSLQSRGEVDAEGALEIQKRLITELPRYKEMIFNVPQYFIVGNDIPECLYDPTLLDTGRDKISLLFAGVGDARHLHKTFLSVGFDKAANEKCFHLTIVDHKSPVIARDILVLLMIHEFSQILDDEEKKATSLIFPLFYYTYLAPIMPALLHDVLQTKIGDAIAMMESPELLPDFLDVPIAFRAEVVRVLKEWQEEAGLEYPTNPVREEVVRLREVGKQNQLNMLQSLGQGEEDMMQAPESCEKELAFYEEFGILTMNWASHWMFYEESLHQAFVDFDVEDPEALNTDFLDEIDESWKTNPTFVDLEWQRNREDSHMYLPVNHDPFETGNDLMDAGAKAPEKQGLLNIVSFWFNGVCHGFSRMRDRCKVEACIGDIAVVLEQVKSGTVGHRPASTQATATMEESSTGPSDNLRLELARYPTAYDRIHLSNIPDYIGGSLSTFLHAIPALHPDESSYVTATCLRNPSRWKSHKHFDNEYIALSDAAELERLFHVRLEPPHDLGGFPSLAQYVKWHHHVVPNSFSNLLSRQQFEAWLYRLFLKMAIPIKREMRHPTLIYSPLNLAAFLRLCGHLHSVGYPAHWISGVLDELLSGTIRTTARPPRTDPLAIEEADAKMPMLKQCTKPFVAELTTLMSLWQFALPFGVLSKEIPDVQKVHRYELEFPKCEDFFGETPVFVLVLFHLKTLPGEAGDNLRPVLLDDELADTWPKAREARETSLHVITTWKWKRTTKTATFWLREDVIDACQGNEWGLAIWRTDSWIMHSGPRGLKGLRDMGKFVRND